MNLSSKGKCVKGKLMFTIGQISGYLSLHVMSVCCSLLTYSKPWVTGFFCQGDEPTPMTCLNTGFNSTFLMDLCQGRRENGA